MGRKAGKKNLNKTPSSEKTTRRQSHIRNAHACRRQTPQSGDSLAVHTLPRAASPPRTLWPLPWVSSRLIQERVLIARRLPLYPNSLPCEQPAFTCAASSPLAPAVSWETPEASPSWTLKRLQQRSAPWLEPSPHRASRRSPEDLLELWPQLSPPPSPPRSPPCSPRQPRRRLARNSPTRSSRPSAQRLQSPPQSPQRSPQTSPRQSGQRLPLRYPQRLPQQSSGHSAQNLPPHSHRQSPQPTPQNSSQLSLQQPPPYAPSPSPPPTPASSSHTSQARTPQKSPLLSPQQSVQRSPQLSPERTEQYSPQPSPQRSLQSFSEHRPSEQSLPLQKQSPALSLQSSSLQLPCQSRSESLFLTPPETPSHSPARFAPALEAEAAPEAPAARRPWPDQQRSGLTARAQKIARSPRRALRKLKRLAACSKGSLSSSSARSNSSVRQQILGHILKEDSSWLTQSGAESVEEMVRSRRRQRPSPARLDHAHAHAKAGPRSKRAAEATAPQESETPFEKPQKTETKAKVKVQGVAKKKVRTKTDKNETVQLNNSKPTKSETVSKETEEVPCTKEMNAKKHDETKLKTELKAKPPLKTTSENKRIMNATGESAIKIETAEDSKIPIGNCKANEEGATYATKPKVSKAKATTETQTEAEAEGKEGKEAKAKGRAASKEALHRGVGPRVAVSLCDGRDSWPLRISQWHVSGHGQIVLSCSLSQHSQFGATPRHFECLPGLIMRGQMLAPSGMSLSTSSPSTPTLMSSIASTPSPYSALSHIPILPSLSSPTLAQQLPGAAFIPFASIPTAVALPVPFPAMSTATAQTAAAQTPKAPPPTSPVMPTPAASPTETPSVNPMPASTSHPTAPPMPQTASMPTSTPDSKFINTAPLPSPSTPITPSYQVKNIPRRSKISGQDDLLVAKDKSTLPAKTHLTDSNMKTRHELNVGMLRIRQFLCDKKWEDQSNFTVDPRFVSLCRQPNGTHVTHDHKLDDNLIVGEEHVTPECSGKQELSKVYQKISNSKHSKEIQTSPSIRLQDISVTSDIREKRQDQRPNEYVKESPLLMSHTTRRAQRKSQFSPTRIQNHTSAVKRCAPNLSLGGKRHISIAPGIAKLHLRKGINVDKRRVVRSLTGITQHSRSKLGPRSRLAHRLQPDGTSKRRSHKHTPADTSAVPEKKTPPAVPKRRARRDARRQDESPTNEPVGAKKTREARKKRILTTTTATSPIRKLRKRRRAQAVQQPAVDSAESIQSSCLSSGSSLAQPATGARKANHAQPSPSKAPQVKTTSVVTKTCRKSVESEEDPTDTTTGREQSSRQVVEQVPSTHRRQQLPKISPTDCRKVPCIPEAATLRSRDGRREDGPRSDQRLATAGSPRDRSPPEPLQRLPSSASRPSTGTPRRGRTLVTADSRGAQRLASADQRQRYGSPSVKRARLNRTPSAASRRSHRSPSVDSRRLRVTPTRRYSTSARPSDISEETFARDQQQQRFREPEDVRYADERHETRSIPGRSARCTEGRALYGRYDASPPPPPPSPAPAPPLHRRFAPALRQWPLLRRMRTALLSPLSCVKARIAPSSTYTAGPRKDHKLRQYISESEA